MDSGWPVLAYRRAADAIASRESNVAQCHGIGSGRVRMGRPAPADERIALPVSTTAGSWRPLFAAVLAAGTLTACSGEGPPPPVTSPPAPPPATLSSATGASVPPIPSQTAPTPSPAPNPAPKPKPAEPVQGSCGTVTAASGLTLQVLNGPGVPCADATGIVGSFHKTIAGRQSAGSDEPVSETVDGWLCVSGAPAAQGGTSCSKGEQNVFAAVVPVE